MHVGAWLGMPNIPQAMHASLTLPLIVEFSHEEFHFPMRNLHSHEEFNFHSVPHAHSTAAIFTRALVTSCVTRCKIKTFDPPSWWGSFVLELCSKPVKEEQLFFRYGGAWCWSSLKTQTETRKSEWKSVSLIKHLIIFVMYTYKLIYMHRPGRRL